MARTVSPPDIVTIQRSVKPSSLRKRLHAASLSTQAGATLAILVILVPITWLTLTSLRYTRDIMAAKLVTGLTGANFGDLFAPDSSFLALFRNSIFTTLCSTLVVLVIGSFAAYSLAYFRWPRWLTLTLLGWGIVVNVLPQIAMVPALYSLAQSSGLYDTPWILIAAYSFFNAPLALMILKVGFDTIPRELLEAAQLDGCSDLRIFWRIVMPLAVPSVVAAGLLTAILCWDDFILALSLTSTSAGMTIPVGLSQYVQEYQITYGPMAASALIAILPVLLIVIFAQRYLVQGLTGGAIKG